MKVKASTRIFSLLLAMFIALGAVPSYNAADLLSGGPASGDVADGPADEPGDSGEDASPADDEGGASGDGTEAGEPDGEAPDDGESGGDEASDGQAPDGANGDGGNGGDGEDGENDPAEPEPGEGEDGDGQNGENGQNDEEEPGEEGDGDEQGESGGSSGSGSGSGGGESKAARLVVEFSDWDGEDRVEVPVGTPEEALDLPDTLTVRYIEETEDGEETGSEALAVSWRCAEYDAQTPGSYRFAATLPAGWELDEGLRAPSVEVVVLGAGQAPPRVIAGFPEYEGETPEFFAELGTPLEELDLPASVDAVYHEGDEENEGPGARAQTGRVAVSWTLLEEAYDPELLPATYHFEAVLDEAGWELAEGVALPVLAVSMRVGVVGLAAGDPIQVYSNGSKVGEDYTTIAAAIAAINSNSWPNPELHFMTEGSYPYTGTMPANIALVGEATNGDVIIAGTENWYSGTSSTLVLDNVTLQTSNSLTWGEVSLHVASTAQISHTDATGTGGVYLELKTIVFRSSETNTALYTNIQLSPNNIELQGNARIVYNGPAWGNSDDTRFIYFLGDTLDYTSWKGTLTFDVEFEGKSQTNYTGTVPLIDFFFVTYTEEDLKAIVAAEVIQLGSSYHSAMDIKGDDSLPSNSSSSSSTRRVIMPYRSGCWSSTARLM